MESVLRKVGVAPAFSGVDSGLKAEPAEPTSARDRVATDGRPLGMQDVLL